MSRLLKTLTISLLARLAGMSFSELIGVLPNYMEEWGEQRFQIIGMTRNLVLLLSVFVERGSDVIRIVSARKAVDYEKSIYNDQFR